jgi:hypothetical protein
VLAKSRNQIISELFKSKEFNDCINKMEPEHLRNDLKAEVMLILCELDEKKLLEIYKTGGLAFYTVRIILNLIQSNTSPFYKKYRQVFTYMAEERYVGTERVVFEDSDHHSIRDPERVRGIFFAVAENEDMIDRKSKEQFEQKVYGFIDELYWYDAEILKLYLELGSYREVEKATGIKWTSVYDTVTTAIGIIKSKLRQNAITTIPS